MALASRSAAARLQPRLGGGGQLCGRDDLWAVFRVGRDPVAGGIRVPQALPWATVGPQQTRGPSRAGDWPRTARVLGPQRLPAAWKTGDVQGRLDPVASEGCTREDPLGCGGGGDTSFLLVLISLSSFFYF